MGYQRVRRDRQRNLVAKHSGTFNKPATQLDRKKAQKAGKLKHKARGYNDGI